jgi:glycosyltransferase involved in cell wall biosynthesis
MTAQVTIGIPVYNEGRFIAKTIESALSQSLAEIKVIITDNCSEDESYSIARAYAERDARIQLFRQPTNLGALANFKASLDMADTEYFVWLGGHDVFTSDYIQMAVNVLSERKDIVMVYPKAIMIDEFDKAIGHADSDIDTLDCVNIRKRLYKVAQNLVYCTSIHGVFRTETLRKAPIKQVIGGDHLILFSAACSGQIKMLPLTGILRRQHREETLEEKKERWQKAGLYAEVPGVSPYIQLAIEHMRLVLALQSVTIIEKAKLIRGIRNIFKSRFGIPDLAYLRSVHWDFY